MSVLPRAQGAAARDAGEFAPGSSMASPSSVLASAVMPSAATPASADAAVATSSLGGTASLDGTVGIGGVGAVGAGDKVEREAEPWVAVGGSWRDEENVCGYWRFSEGAGGVGPLEEGKQVRAVGHECEIFLGGGLRVARSLPLFFLVM